MFSPIKKFKNYIIFKNSRTFSVTFNSEFTGCRMQHVCAVWHLLVVVLTPGNHYSVFLLSVLICCSHIQGSLYFFFFFFFVRARRSGDDDLTVMEAVPMYHVCSFHKRLQAQLIPFRSWNTWRREKKKRKKNKVCEEESFHTMRRNLASNDFLPREKS